MRRLLFLLACLMLPPALGQAGPDASARAARGGAKGKVAKGKARKDKARKGKARKSKKARRLARRKSKKKGIRTSKLCDHLTPIHTHEVVTGEIVGEIAGRYGVTIKDLQRLNRKGLKNPDRIREGQKIRVCPMIPPRERLREDYIVKSGDTFGAIARRFDLTQDELKAFQLGKLKNPDKLSVGQTLIIWRDGDVLADFLPPDQDKGSLKMAVRLRPSSHYRIKRPKRSFGTRRTVQTIHRVINKYRRRHKGPVLVMGDLSKRGGGPISGHVSHQKGLDVDLGFVHTKKAGKLKDFIKANKKNLDVRRTWALVRGFLETGEVQYMFIDHDIQKLLYEEARKQRISKSKLAQWFQYPRSPKRAHGIVRHWKNHDDHIHIRFRR